MPTIPPDLRDRARLRGKRAGLGVVLAVAVVFVAASAVQIVSATFGVNVTPLRVDGNALVAVCAQGIRVRLDRAIAQASGGAPAPTRSEARSGPVLPDREWPDEADVRRACEKVPAGLDAWASLARLRSAEKQLRGGDDQDIQALIRDVDAHLPSDMR